MECEVAPLVGCFIMPFGHKGRQYRCLIPSPRGMQLRQVPNGGNGLTSHLICGVKSVVFPEGKDPNSRRFVGSANPTTFADCSPRLPAWQAQPTPIGKNGGKQNGNQEDACDKCWCSWHAAPSERRSDGRHDRSLSTRGLLPASFPVDTWSVAVLIGSLITLT